MKKLFTFVQHIAVAGRIRHWIKPLELSRPQPEQHQRFFVLYSSQSVLHLRIQRLVQVMWLFNYSRNKFCFSWELFLFFLPFMFFLKLVSVSFFLFF